MFKIVLLVYIVLSGAPPDEPYPFAKRQSFAGLDACQAYLKSDVFAAERGNLARFALATLRPETKTPADPDSLSVPGVSITASCVEDDRI